MKKSLVILSLLATIFLASCASYHTGNHPTRKCDGRIAIRTSMGKM